MSCPICKVNHLKLKTAEVCRNQVDNEMIHYIILTQGMTGGMTEENLLEYKHIKDLSHFRKTKRLSEEMKLYVNQFK